MAEKDVLIKMAGIFGALGVTELYVDGVTIPCEKPPQDPGPLTGHGDPVCVGDRVRVTRTSDKNSRHRDTFEGTLVRYWTDEDQRTHCQVQCGDPMERGPVCFIMGGYNVSTHFEKLDGEGER